MSAFFRKLPLPGGDGCCDCLIRTDDGGLFRAHRSFLCTTSPFFRAAFCTEYGSRREVLLTGVSASVLDLLLGYYYADELHINNGNVAEVLAAADMLVMDEARDLCLDHLLNNMDVDNCLSLASLAQWHHWPGFRDTVFAFVREHFDAVWRSSSEFSKASAALLVELFSSSELNVRDEVDLLRAVRRWYTRGRARTKQRIAGLLALLQCARIGLCRESVLTEFRQMNPMLANSSAYHVAVCEALQRGPCVCSASPLLLLHFEGVELEECKALASVNPRHGDVVSTGSTASGAPESALSQYPCERCSGANPERWLPRVPHEVLFVVGGWSSGEERDAVEAYDPRAYRWLMHTMQGTSPSYI
ncbi:kelch-like protein 10 [Amblyomma americanum]